MFAYAWAKDPLINGIIAQSGSANIRPRASASASAVPAWFRVSEALGCGPVELGEKAMECMRGKTSQEVQKVLENQTGGSTMSFGPVPDGKVIFSDTAARAKSGNFAKVVSFEQHFFTLGC